MQLELYSCHESFQIFILFQEAGNGQVIKSYKYK